MSELGTFVPGASWLHRAPAGAKLLALAAVAVATVFLREPWQTAILLAVAVGLYPLAGLPRRVLLAQLRPLRWVLALLLVFQLVVTGWQAAVVVTGTMLALVLLAGLVSCTTRTTALVDVVQSASRPLRPLGVDPERVGLMLALGIRSVPVVIGLAGEVREAQLARGLGSSPTAYAVPLVVRSLRHADRLGEALAARGLED